MVEAMTDLDLGSQVLRKGEVRYDSTDEAQEKIVA